MYAPIPPQYTEAKLIRYIGTLPRWRRFLARYFEKYKITKEEYDTWLIEDYKQKLFP